MNKVRGYIFSRPFMGERVPQHVQNLVIRDYCERNQLQFLLSATEYAMPNCHLIFEQILSELSGLQGVVAYSLFQLPESEERREHIYKLLLQQMDF
jgi:sporadic carbohydrate cluster protein (TIGR04323 family)